MASPKIIYCSLVCFILVIAIVMLMHLNMWTSMHLASDRYLSVSPKTVNFDHIVINRTRMFNGLIDWFETFSSSLSGEKQCHAVSKFLKRRFPTIYKSSIVTTHTIGLSHLIEVHTNSTLTPYLITIDIDIDHGNNWPDFTEKVQVDYIKETLIGNGVVSYKSIIMAVFESLKAFLRNIHHHPVRPFSVLLLCSGQAYNHSSAEQALQHFTERRKQFEYILESPGVVLNDSTILGLDQPVGVIGITRKGYIASRLISTYHHHPSSDISLKSTIAAISLNTPNKFGHGIEMTMMKCLALHASYFYRLVYSNQWFFKPFLSHRMNVNLYWKRVVKTSTNLVNYGWSKRSTPLAIIEQTVHPELNVYDVEETNSRIMLKGHDNVRLQLLDIYQPILAQYTYRTEAFIFIKHSFETAYPNSIAIPGDSFASSSLRNFENITSCIYQFAPVIINHQAIERYETNHEQLSLSQYISMIRFYYNLFQMNNHKHNYNNDNQHQHHYQKQQHPNNNNTKNNSEKEEEEKVKEKWFAKKQKKIPKT